MERRPEIGLKSYDRFFPNQDTLPVGDFGNLIALPLQENGYFVLRFLAEDVGKDLDMVLDTIKRALFSRRDCNTGVVTTDAK